MMKPYNILVAGVGGQGNLVCGRALAQAAVIKGYRPVVGDTFGASRRGGSVVTHLRISNKDLGPLVPKGQANLIIGMEPLEALRIAVRYANSNTVIVTSKIPVKSLSTITEEVRYPSIDELATALQSLSTDVLIVDPEPTLDKVGSYRVLNVYMLGVTASLNSLPLDRESIEIGIDHVVGLKGDNLEAFESGFQDARQLH
ncbi:MAG: 2-oxoacid:acceptor oxidoreductase family protein [Candidatus Thorarchaeota archaeon]